MKHPLGTTALLILLFVTAQVVGLGLLYQSQHVDVIDGVTTVTIADPIIGPRPETTGGQSFLLIGLGVLIGTGLVLLLIKLKAWNVWKGWFTLAVWLSLSIALGVILPPSAAYSAAFVLAIWKVFRPNPVVHNLTEILIYSGIMMLVAPLFDLWWAVALLLAISVYDMVAVWWSGHMVTLATEQASQNLFAGFYLPGAKEGKTTLTPPSPPASSAAKQAKVKGAAARTAQAIPLPPTTSGSMRGAVLGGGDIAFPLIFSGSAFTWFITTRAATAQSAFFLTLFVTVGATIALTGLLLAAKKDRFYPAMPFLTAGCLIGFGLAWIIA